MKFLLWVFLTLPLLVACNSVSFVLKPEGPGGSFEETSVVWSVSGLKEDFPDLPDTYFFRVHVPPDFVGKPIYAPITITPYRFGDNPDLFKEKMGRELLPSEKDQLAWRVQMPVNSPLRVNSLRPSSVNLLDILLSPNSDKTLWQDQIGLGEFFEHEFIEKPFAFPETEQNFIRSLAKFYSFKTQLITEKENGDLELEVSKHQCTSFSVGRSLVMTNAHCVSTPEDCRFSAFRFSKTTTSFWGFVETTVTEDFLCKKILAVSKELDFVLVEVFGNPSEKYGRLPMDLKPKLFKTGSQIRKYVANPTRSPEKQSFSCEIKESLQTCFATGHGQHISQHCANHYTEKIACEVLSKSGDSGSPIIDSQGNVVGINWGSQPAYSVLSPKAGEGTNPKKKPILAESFSLFTPSWAIHAFLRKNKKEHLIPLISAE